MISRVFRFLQRLLRQPQKTLATLPDQFESFRMHLRGESVFRRPQDVAASASSCPSLMIDRILHDWAPKSVLDVGCGSGTALAYFKSKGVEDVLGLDGSSVARSMSPIPERIKIVDLSKPILLNRKFDLVYSVEVAEHIHPSAAATFVENLACHGDRILLTAARPGQGGLGHLNEQLPAYWIDLLNKAGFVYDGDATESLRALGDLYAENLIIARRA